MAKINNSRAQELGRFVTYNRKTGKAKGRIIRSDGSVLGRRGDGWKVTGHVTIDPYDFWQNLEHKVNDGIEVIRGATEPAIDTIMRWEMDYGHCKSLDGCRVDPDGTCPHGYPSWLLVKGLI